MLYAFNYEALHVRSMDDLCYYFALIHGIPYDEAEQEVKEEKAKPYLEKLVRQINEYDGENWIDKSAY